MNVLPEGTVIAEISLVVAPFTFVISVNVSHTPCTQVGWVTGLIGSGDAARIEEISHTWANTHTLVFACMHVQVIHSHMVCSYCLFSAYNLIIVILAPFELYRKLTEQPVSENIDLSLQPCFHFLFLPSFTEDSNGTGYGLSRDKPILGCMPGSGGSSFCQTEFRSSWQMMKLLLGLPCHHESHVQQSFFAHQHHKDSASGKQLSPQTLTVLLH